MVSAPPPLKICQHFLWQNFFLHLWQDTIMYIMSEITALIKANV